MSGRSPPYGNARAVSILLESILVTRHAINCISEQLIQLSWTLFPVSLSITADRKPDIVCYVQLEELHSKENENNSLLIYDLVWAQMGYSS